MLLLILLPLFSVACNLSPGCQVSDPISKEDSGSCSEVFETTIPDNGHHTSIQPCGILSCFQTFAVLFWISMYLFSGVTFTGLLVTCWQDHFYHIDATLSCDAMYIVHGVQPSCIRNKEQKNLSMIRSTLKAYVLFYTRFWPISVAYLTFVIWDRDTCNR